MLCMDMGQGRFPIEVVLTCSRKPAESSDNNEGAKDDMELACLEWEHGCSSLGCHYFTALLWDCSGKLSW